MKSVETKVRNNKFVFYTRTWDGIDKPEYDDIMSLNVVDALSLIEELKTFVENTKKHSFITVEGMQMNIEHAIKIRQQLNEKLKEYGE